MKGFVILWCILLLWPFYLYSMTQTQKWQIFSQIFSVCTISNWRVISLKNLSSIGSYFLEVLGRETDRRRHWGMVIVLQFISQIMLNCHEIFFMIPQFSTTSTCVMCTLSLNNKTEKLILSLPCKAKLLRLISSLQYKIDSKCFKMTLAIMQWFLIDLRMIY